MSVTERGGRFQLKIKSKLLPSPYYDTFATREEAETFGSQLKTLLKAGVIPEFLKSKQAPAADDPLMPEVIRGYTKSAPVTDSDNALLDVLIGNVSGFRVSAMTVPWVDNFIRSLKVNENNTPGTIRKKIGTLARVMHWHIRRTTPDHEKPRTNPFRNLPRGYSLYSKEDTDLLKEGKKAKVDQERERRLSGDEEAAFLRVLDGIPAKTDATKWRVDPRPDLKMFFQLIVDTGLRMSEAYSIRKDQIHFDRGFMVVNGSKGHRGKIKYRNVPLKPHIAEKLREYTKNKVGLIFPWWDGSKEGKLIATRDLVQLFKRSAKHAGIQDITEHDLRHEACCRWFELRDKKGSWVFSDVEITKIMGWSNYAMILRYASIRGEDLASRLKMAA